MEIPKQLVPKGDAIKILQRNYVSPPRHGGRNRPGS